MQVQTVNGPRVIEEQTVHPFTNNLRRFNLKEANTSAGCINKIKDNVDEYTNDILDKKSQFEKKYNETIKSEDNRKGLIKLNTENNIVNNDGSIITRIYNNRLIDQPIPQYDVTDYGEGLETFDNAPEDVNPEDYRYNSYADWRAPTFNQWTRVYDDNCNEDSRLRISSKPMKYYVNQYNSPQVDPFFEYTIIGNQKQYNVRNEFERPIPTRLNPLYPTQIEPYSTTPFLGATNPSRLYTDTSDVLRWGNDSIRDKKSLVALSEKDYDRFDIVSEKTVQNAGQFNLKSNGKSTTDFYYDYNEPNHVIFGNSSNIDQFGVPTRSYLRNFVDLVGL